MRSSDLALALSVLHSRSCTRRCSFVVVVVRGGVAEGLNMNNRHLPSCCAASGALRSMWEVGDGVCDLTGYIRCALPQTLRCTDRLRGIASLFT